MTGIIREPKFKHRHRMILWGMYVSPGGRGTGLASQLLACAIGYARSCPEIEYVCLSATSSSEKALELYRRAGFLKWGREPCSFILGNLRLDGIHMMLSLRGSAPGGSDGGPGTAGSS
jgi:ribosomal protein S18 acetylase RimI-like enzyme